MFLSRLVKRMVRRRRVELPSLRKAERYEQVLLESRRFRFRRVFAPFDLRYGLDQIRSAGREEDEKVRQSRDAKRSTKKRRR